MSDTQHELQLECAQIENPFVVMNQDLTKSMMTSAKDTDLFKAPRRRATVPPCAAVPDCACGALIATPGRSVARRDAIYSDFPLCVFSLSVQYFMDATLLNDLEEQVANLHSAVRELKQALDRKNEAIQRPQTPTPLSGCS